MSTANVVVGAAMQFAFERMPILQYASSNRPPFARLARAPRQRWVIVDRPLIPGQPVQFAICKTGDTVLIPLIPYDTPSDAELLAGFTFQQGVTFAQQVPGLQLIQLVIGYPVVSVKEADGGPMLWRTYLGVAGYSMDG